MPGDESFFSGQVIKAIVEFHSVELLRIKSQPLRFGQTFRIIETTPVVVMPTTATNIVFRRHLIRYFQEVLRAWS